MANKFHTNLIVSSAPHIVTESDTTRLMGTVILALAPAWVASIYIFGLNALILSIVCVAASVLFEFCYNKIMHKTQTIGDLSAALTGLLIAFNVPSTFPLWQAIVGCAFAIIVVKQLFGGIGRNFSNPAITARIFLFISFAGNMSTWPVTRLDATDAVTGPTPLAILAEGGADAQLPSLGTLFLGFHGGSTGEIPRRIHRRSLRTRTDHRRRLSDRPQGHQPDHPMRIHRNSIRLCTYRNRQPPHGSVPRTCRRRAPRSILHGN